MQIPFLGDRVRVHERTRFALLAVLLLFNALILESNEVLATGGFANQVGALFLPWLWAADMLIVMLTSALYSLQVDRSNRNRLTIWVLTSLAIAYLLLYIGFVVQLPQWLTYSLFAILTDQQWLLVPLLVWALANDAFSTSAAKRLIPLLGLVVLGGQFIGNTMTALLASVLSDSEMGSINLLLTNAGMLLLLAVVFGLSTRVIHINARRANHEIDIIGHLREGIEFIAAIPAYRFLAIAMMLMGFALNIIEFHFIWRVADAYTTLADLQFFYGMFKSVVILLLAVVQGWVVTKLQQDLGFERIFGSMPIAISCGLLLAFLGPGIYGIVVGNLITRVTLLGIDEPARHAFQGLVPDERRGRVSAVMDGYLYPIGAILSCGVLLFILTLVRFDYIALVTAQTFYLVIAMVCAGCAFYAITHMYATYDESMLNWRLQRKRRSSQLDNLNF